MKRLTVLFPVLALAEPNDVDAALKALTALSKSQAAWNDGLMSLLQGGKVPAAAPDATKAALPWFFNALSPSSAQIPHVPDVHSRHPDDQNQRSLFGFHWGPRDEPHTSFTH